MKRSFHSAAQTLIRFLGYPAEKLDTPFSGAFFTYLENGAIKKVGEIESVEILTATMAAILFTNLTTTARTWRISSVSGSSQRKVQLEPIIFMGMALVP
ncbi:hypothetical protein BDV25DRAFT_152453 [Aspergillus avenaceus]|uniref:Uncharacterized protein n=1 Tax=Aspergillus avenaceus TaxID=36643 RepID=A0A5N6TZ21_ASPAV|nr:hypothetical protein BDV25DRAFT_152453 [Aspergillus avenaceus]